MIGTSPVLPTNAAVNDQIPMQFDYRQIYTTVMQDWLCMSESEAAEVLGGNYVKLPIFDKTLSDSINFEDENNQGVLLYPNPSTDGILKVLFSDTVNTNVQFTVFSINGSLIYNTVEFILENNSTLYYQNLSSGMYLLSIEWNRKKVYKKFIIE
jgi:hypothetical protein